MKFQHLILFHFSIIIFFADSLSAQAEAEYCNPTTGNYTQDDPYREDLDYVLYSLARTNNGFGFFNSTSGQANAAALCRGDIDPDSCQRCVYVATRKLQQVCSNQIEAAGWYNSCFLSYSNRTVLGAVGSGISACSVNNVSDSSLDQWNQSVTELWGQLRPEAAGGGELRKYASGKTSGPDFSMIYGVMQCQPNLTESQCNECLQGAMDKISRCCNTRRGGWVYKLSCILRYENYKFFNNTWYPPSERSKSKSIIVGVIVGPTGVVMVALLGFFIFRRCQKIKRKGTDLLRESQGPYGYESDVESKHQREDDDTGEMNYFNLTTIQAATNNFSSGNKLGEGGFGPVYMGTLQDGKKIAVKRLSRNSGQGLEEFKTEVKLIIKLQHKNLVRLLGYCVKGNERLLIYEFMANNSLDTFLFDANKGKEFDWAKRSSIVIGIAKGLQYLHEDSRLKIVHRDMKASNVLLDDELNAKISDFGTARIFGGNQMEANTNRIVGTYGYMAPEYAMEGLFSTKSDVYSFGVLLLEIISGQRNNKFYLDDQPKNLLSTAWRLWKEGKGEKLIDQRLNHDCSINVALRWVNIALLCVQEDPQDRPTMSNVVYMLEGEWTVSLPTPSEPPLSFARFAILSDQSTTTGGGSNQTSSKGTSSSTLIR